MKEGSLNLELKKYSNCKGENIERIGHGGRVEVVQNRRRCCRIAAYTIYTEVPLIVSALQKKNAYFFAVIVE